MSGSRYAKGKQNDIWLMEEKLCVVVYLLEHSIKLKGNLKPVIRDLFVTQVNWPEGVLAPQQVLKAKNLKICSRELLKSENETLPRLQCSMYNNWWQFGRKVMYWHHYLLHGSFLHCVLGATPRSLAWHSDYSLLLEPQWEVLITAWAE